MGKDNKLNFKKIFIGAFAFIMASGVMMQSQEIHAEEATGKALLGDNGCLTFTYDGNTYEEGDTYTNSMGTTTLTEVYTVPTSSTGVGDIPWYGSEGRADITNITIMKNFKGATLTSLDSFFRDLKYCTEIKGLENINTSSVTDMDNAFENYAAKTTAQTLVSMSDWNVGAVTTMTGMFKNANISGLSLTDWTFTKSVAGTSAFEGCQNLEMILANNNWASAGFSGTDVFKDCVNIKGGIDTVYDAKHTGSEYAKPGDGSVAGYFTGEAMKVYVRTDDAKIYSDEKMTVEAVFPEYTRAGFELTGFYSEEEKGKKILNADGTFAADSVSGWIQSAAWCITGNVKLFAHWKSVGTGKAILCSNGNLTFIYDNNTYTVGGSFTDNLGTSTILAVYEVPENSASASDIPWAGMETNGYREDIISVNFDASFSSYELESIAYWFYEDRYISSFINLDNINMSGVLNADYAFKGTGYELTSFKTDFSTLDMSTVSSVEGMFEDTGYKATIWSIGDLSGWDVSNVTNMSGTFKEAGYNADNWTVGDLSGWETGKVTDMSEMFNGTGKEAGTEWTLGDISKWDTSKVTTIEGMFEDACMYNGADGKLDLSTWDTSKVTTMQDTFKNCQSITELNISGWTTTSATGADVQKGMFTGCDYLKKITLGEGFMWRSTDADCRLPKQDSSNIPRADGKWYNESTQAGYEPKDIPDNTAATYTAVPFAKVAKAILCANGNMTFVYDTKEYSAGDTFTDNLAATTITNVYNVPEKLYDLSLSNNISELLASYTTLIPWWAEADNIKSVNFDSSYAEYKPKGVSFLLSGLEYLTSVTNISNLNTSETTDFTLFLYESCRKVGDAEITIDLTGLVKNQATNLKGMFFEFGYLYNTSNKKINLIMDDWNTSNVTNMDYMFYFAHVLGDEYFDVSGFSTDKLTSAKNMFENAMLNVENDILDLSDWNVDKLKYMEYMFGGFETKNSDDVVSEDIRGYAINLTGWTPKAVVTCSNMFVSSHLRTIICDKDWSSYTSESDMFNNATRLVGGNGTPYSSSHKDASYARPDGANPGYFSQGNLYIYYDANGGEGAPEKTLRTPGTPTTISSTIPTYTGKVFAGWTTIKTNSTPQFAPNDNINYNGNIILYAVWKTRKAKALLGANKNLSFVYDANTYTVNDSYTDNLGTTTIAAVYSVPDTMTYNQSSCGWIGSSSDKRSDIESVNFDSSFYGFKPTSLSYMFYYDGYINSITNIANINTSDVTNMSEMFSYTGSELLTFNIDVSDLDVSGVENLSYMFNYTGNKANVWSIGDLSEWDVSAATNICGMFTYTATGTSCTTWTIGDLSEWDVSNVTAMSYMFKNAGTKATTWSIGDISEWNVSNCKNFGYMFANSGIRGSLDLSGWNAVTTATSAFNATFYGCEYLEELDISGLSSKSGSSMFTNCNRLWKVKVGNQFSWGSTAESYRLPTPSTYYITGADGNWYNETTKEGYATTSVPNNVAATYIAHPPIAIITFNSNGGTGTMSQQVYKETDRKTLSYCNFTRTGYTFEGWAESENGPVAYTNSQTCSFTKDTTLYAVWKANSRAIEFFGNGGERN